MNLDGNHMGKTNYTKSYAYSQIETSDFKKLIEIFLDFAVFIEIVNVETSSELFQSINKNEDYDYQILNQYKEFADVMIHQIGLDAMPAVLECIVKSKPEIIIFHFTSKQDEAEKMTTTNISSKGFSKNALGWIVEIMFDELVAIVATSCENTLGNEVIIQKLDNLFSKV